MTHPYDAGGRLQPGATVAVNNTGVAEPVTAGAPWPIVAECHGHRGGVTCPQCDGTHEHHWKAWKDAPTSGSGSAVVGGVSGPGVPVRCTSCGGRKCDIPNCRLRRHHLGEDHEPF